MYEKRPTRWRDVARTRGDVFPHTVSANTRHKGSMPSQFQTQTHGSPAVVTNSSLSKYLLNLLSDQPFCVAKVLWHSLTARQSHQRLIDIGNVIVFRQSHPHIDVGDKSKAWVKQSSL